MTIGLLEKILSEQPQFHRGDTEIKRTVTAQETVLRGPMLEGVLKAIPACYGIQAMLARFLFDSVAAGSKTLETGSGISTLVFALRRAWHVAITPNPEEVANIRSYAADRGIALDRIEFVSEESDRYLPRCEHGDLDLVLIDGKHAFPWPIVDWFYTADRLKQNGLVVLDDLEIASVALLADFIREDHPRWKVERQIGKRTLVVRKMSARVHDVSWHMQPYLTRRHGRRAKLLNALGLHADR